MRCVAVATQYPPFLIGGGRGGGEGEVGEAEMAVEQGVTHFGKEVNEMF